MPPPQRSGVLRSTMSPAAPPAPASASAPAPTPGSARAVLPERRTSGPQGIRGAPRGGRMRVSIAEVTRVDPPPAPVPTSAPPPPPQLPSIAHFAWPERSDEPVTRRPSYYTTREPPAAAYSAALSPTEDDGSPDELELEGDELPSAPASLPVSALTHPHPAPASGPRPGYTHGPEQSVDALLSAASEGPNRSAARGRRLSYDSDDSDAPAGESGAEERGGVNPITKADLRDMEARLKSHMDSEMGRATDSLVGRITEALVQRIVHGLASPAMSTGSAASPIASNSRPLASGRKRKAPSSIPSEADGSTATRLKAESSTAADTAPDPFLNARLRVLARHIFVLPDVHRVAAASQRELVERALRIVDGQDGPQYHAYYAVDPAFLLTNKEVKRGMNKALYSHRSGVMTALSKVDDHTPTRQLVEGALTARVPDVHKLITQESLDKVMSWRRSLTAPLIPTWDEVDAHWNEIRCDPDAIAQLRREDAERFNGP